jgi:microcystin-dependent protein
MSEPFIGMIVMFAGNFAPRGWAFCQGQILSIAQNTALFSILGTTYGGNGQTTFALPDLRSRVPAGQGQGPGLSSYSLGQQSGSETVTLIQTQMPAHGHFVACSSDDATSGDPSLNFPSAFPQKIYSSAATPGKTMNTAMIAQTGGSQPHNNIQPYLCINFIIALEGIFPSRN